MDAVHDCLIRGFQKSEEILEETDRNFLKVGKSIEAYVTRAKESLQKRHLINPKPMKRFMRVQEEEKEDEEEWILQKHPSPEQPLTILEPRPSRMAKAKAAENLKELPLGAKMRNDQNNVTIKKERSSSLVKSNSRESIKENKKPETESVNQKRKSPDEGIQSASESEGATTKSSKRSSSVEIISDKLVSIDITTNDEIEAMPPPAIPKKNSKKTRTKQKPLPVEEPPSLPEGQPLRITRSKIKQEKISLLSAPATEPEASQSVKTVSANESKADETTKTKKPKKKYPMPILIKIEPSEVKSTIDPKPVTPPVIENNEKCLEETEAAALPQNCNDTYRVEPTANEAVKTCAAVNETVTIGPLIGDTTVTLSKNIHDSLMTSDNDDEDASNVPPPLPPKKQPVEKPMKLKNEVFNPYMSSPVKQKIQAFEKHATLGITPDKFNTLPAKFKNGTPSKIAVFAKTTPLNTVKHIKMTSSSAGPSLTGTTPGHNSKKPQKMNSLSQESLEDARKNHHLLNQQLEEKRKNREEKMRQAQLQREAMEKEKRDQVLKAQQERDEKYRKIMREKEEKQRMEAMKKKILKEKQAKKYAEEKAKKDEFAVPKPVDSAPQGAVSKNDSLMVKLQKSIISSKKKNEMKNVYSFDMLNTDDETDDESRPSSKRPPVPEWSLKNFRKPFIQLQSFVAPAVLDTFFGTAPISVDLRAIFPSIEAKKLIRNSSAIWRTPPKHY